MIRILIATTALAAATLIQLTASPIPTTFAKDSGDKIVAPGAYRLTEFEFDKKKVDMDGVNVLLYVYDRVPENPEFSYGAFAINVEPKDKDFPSWKLKTTAIINEDGVAPVGNNTITSESGLIRDGKLVPLESSMSQGSDIRALVFDDPQSTALVSALNYRRYMETKGKTLVGTCKNDECPEGSKMIFKKVSK